MKDNIKLIGRKMKGFRFGDDIPPYYTESLKSLEGGIGVIERVADDCVRVRFSYGVFAFYPLDQVLEHLVPEVAE